MNVRVLWDGNNLAIRNDSVGDFRTVSGIRTNVPYGCLTSMASLAFDIEKLIPHSRVTENTLVWDGGRAKWRTEAFPGYKANRNKDKSKMTEAERQAYETKWREYREQCDAMNEIADHIGVRHIRVKGWEADDVIYAITKLIPPDGFTWLIVSTDEDFLQFVGNGVSVYNPVKNVLYDADSFEDKMGFPQDKFLSYKIMVGDTSDNIKGAVGIGEKTAKSLIAQYGDLSEILSHREELTAKGGIPAKLVKRENLESMDLANLLINLVDFVEYDEISGEVEKAFASSLVIDRKWLSQTFRKFEFFSFLTDFGNWMRVWEQIQA